MKTRFAGVQIYAACLSLAWTAFSACAQGTINFINKVGSLDAPVFHTDGLTRLQGPEFLAQLYAGPAGSLEPVLMPVGDPRPFLTGNAAGYWVPGWVTIPFVFPTQPATMQVRVWEASAGSYEAARSGAGLYGASLLLTLTTGSETRGVAPDMIGLTSFSLVPEPSAGLLLLVAVPIFLFRRRDFTS